jgi:5'-nucleotidase
MTGKFINLDDKQDTDVLALEQGYASVVPIKIDFTDYATKTWLAGQWLDVPEAL